MNSNEGIGKGSGSSDKDKNGTGTGTDNNSGTGNNYGNDDNIYNNPVVPPRVTKSAKPKYPANERNNKIEGVTVIRFLLDKDGSIESATIFSSSGNSALDEAALNAAYKWSFTPAKNSNGQNVRCYVTQPFTF